MIELPFESLEVGTRPEIVTNPYSGESVELAPEAVAVYDYIKGCEILGNYSGMDTCIEWFIQNFPDEYMLLLD